MAAIDEQLRELVLEIDRRVGVRVAAHLLRDEARLVERGGGGARQVAFDQREGVPERVSLKGTDDGDIGFLLHEVQQLQIGLQSGFRLDIARGGEGVVIHN